MNKVQLLVLALVIALIATFVYFDASQYLSLDYLKSEQAALAAGVAADPLRYGFGFMLVYIVVTAASLPGAAVMTLAAGAIFGLGWGLLMVSFASTIGATLAMLLARYLFRDAVQSRFSKQLATINAGVDKEGAFYLFTLRLVPIVPFFVINLAMGLTRIHWLTFFVVSQVGMFAGTIVYVNAGTQLAQIESLSGILSLPLLLSFVLLGVFPLLAKWFVESAKRRRVYRRWQKPSSFDRDIVVIGAGSGGLVAALIGATVNAKVTLIEKHKMGGDCLNTGCVPSKSLIRSAKFAFDVSRARDLGFRSGAAELDFSDVMARVQRVIAAIEPHDSVERYESLGVDCEIGEAMIRSPFEVEVNGKVLTTRNIIVATGAGPFVPPIDGLGDVHYWTSDNVWEMSEQPRRLVVLGGGPIGSELTQAFARLGSEVTQVELAPQIMIREDPEIATMMADTLSGEGVNLLTGHTAKSVMETADGKVLVCVAAADQSEVKVPFDELLVAVGRKANVTGFGLEELGVEITPRGTIAVDDYLRTNYPNIYAIGDVAGPYQFTHTASHMAWYAAVNALFGTFRKFKVDYSVIPWVTFTSPEVARVGLNEQDAQAAEIDYEVTRYDVSGLDRALAEEEAHGVVKVLTAPGSDRILGVTIVADHAGDVLSEYVLAMKHGLGLGKIMGTIHAYPTLAEMNKFAASEWRKAHKPDWALSIAGKYHAFRRGSQDAARARAGG